MRRAWVETLASAYEAELARRSERRATQPMEQMNLALERVRTELREAIAELNTRVGDRYTLSDKDEQTWVVRALIGRSVNDGARFDIDTSTATIRTQPTVSFGFVPPDHLHTFTFDHAIGSFSERGEPVTEEELVRRALEPFLLKNLSLKSAP